MAHVAPWKKDVVRDLESIIRDHRTVAVVSLDRIPGQQLQQIRAKLREHAALMMAKKNLIKIALENTKGDKEGVEDLMEMMQGQTALIGADMNPFKLFKKLDSNNQPMPAKGGEKAPYDIVVEAGETSFPPGPIVGEFGKAGIPAAIDKGKVVIRKTITPVKEGQVISKLLAQALTKLEIYPFTVGVVMNGAWEDGVLYKPEDLDIDMEAYRSNLTYGAQMAFNLAVFTAYTTPITAVPLIQKARSQALSLAVNAGIMNKDTTELILSKAYGGMLALASLMGEEALDDDLRALIQGAAVSQAAAPESAPADEGGAGESKEEESEEEEVSEDDAVAGLGALFG